MPIAYMRGINIDEAREKIFGDALEWFSEAEAYWATTPHYYMPNSRFYNYPYVYAQLFVYALYQKYLEEEEERARAGVNLMGHLERRCCKVIDLDANKE
jgi:oligoendopeptidase F